MPGTLLFAGWSVDWSIPSLQGGGLQISLADFNKTRVLFRATQPFVLVPYHEDLPGHPFRTFKDGLGWASCGSGVNFTSVTPTAPNAPSWQFKPDDPMNKKYTYAQNDNQYDPALNPAGAVMVEKIPASLTEPDKAVIWAKFQAANYQYIHRWEFGADGSIEAKVGLGGRLYTNDPDFGGHIHNFYFRLDFDVVTAANNLVQRFAHVSNASGADQWTGIPVESKQTLDPATFTKWRILNKTPKANGQFRSYELIPGSDGAPDGAFSTGDLWVVRWTGGEDGSEVTCNDNIIGSTYANGQSVDGEDIVVWYCLRAHHKPRQLGEEAITLPYEFIGFWLEPRDFLDDTPKALYPTYPPSPFV